MTQKIFVLSLASVAYVPTPLNNLEAICKALDVGKAKVKEWVELGAPIIVEGEGNNTRYSAELAKLMAWREAYAKYAENTEFSKIEE